MGVWRDMRGSVRGDQDRAGRHGCGGVGKNYVCLEHANAPSLELHYFSKSNITISH